MFVNPQNMFTALLLFDFKAYTFSLDSYRKWTCKSIVMKVEPDWKIHIPINLHTGNNNHKYYSGDSVQMNLRNRFAVFWVEDVYI
jgi:hypothetical protein